MRRLAGAVAVALPALVWLLFGQSGPGRALAQEGFFPDSAAQAESLRADSLRQAFEDSVARADSLAALGLDEGYGEGGAAASLLGRTPPEHPFTYNTSYGTLRNRRTWDQSVDFYLNYRNLVFANRTTVTILEDPDVKRNTRNRSSLFELGYGLLNGVTTGLRFNVTRNSDIIGIREQNSIERDGDEFTAFGRFERTLVGLPVTANLNFGSVNDRQPEYSRQGRQFGADGNTRGTLWRTVTWNLAGNFRTDRLRSAAPTDTGDFVSTDRTTDRSGAGGVSWAPWRWLSLDLKGTSRRGVLQRPENFFDPVSGDQRVVQEEVSTNADNANLGVRFRTPLGFQVTAGGSINNTEIVYAADSTRNNVALSRSFNISGADTLLGFPVTVRFQNGTSENDYTKRADGYVQKNWRRQAELQTNRRLNRRTTTDLRGSVSLESRRYSDFRPSGPSSFAPSSQDLFRTSGSMSVDYRPFDKFTTGLVGQIDLNRTINLASTSSISNTDQVGYQVTWRWGFMPWSFWQVTQNNSAGAQQVSYPFAPDRDQLSFIYQIRTNSVVRLTQRWNLEMNYGLRYQSRGTYRESETGDRRFGKAGGSDQYDLLLRTTYKFASWLSVELNEQRFVTENYSLPEGQRRVDNTTYRRTLFGGVMGNYRFRSGATLALTVRRSLTWDSNERYTVPPTPPTTREDDYWQILATFRTDLDL